MKTLVTGAGGFLGLYIAEQLRARGDEVRGYQRGRYPALEKLGVECIQGDLRDAQKVADACRGVDAVFHTAGVAGIWGPWRHYYEINTLGTEHVLGGCRQHRVPRLILTSSPSVTFDGTDQNGIDETAPYPQSWLCHYPHSKALAEQSVLRANGEGGLLTCSLRPHLIWGPRDQHLIPRLLDRARSGKLRRVGDGRNLVDMIYVENAAEAHLRAADRLIEGSPVAGSAYFLSQGEPVNCWDWINDILERAGVSPIDKSVSFKTAWRIGAVLEFLHWITRRTSEPRMSRFLAAQLATNHHFDIGRAQRDFGYRPTISTEEGMRRLSAEFASMK